MSERSYHISAGDGVARYRFVGPSKLECELVLPSGELKCFTHQCHDETDPYAFMRRLVERVWRQPRRSSLVRIGVQGPLLGTSPIRGEKLDEEAARFIRHRYTGKRGQVKELARRYGVSRQHIWAVLTGRAWA